MPGGVCVTDEGARMTDEGARVITRLCVPLTESACVATFMFACVYCAQRGDGTLRHQVCILDPCECASRAKRDFAGVFKSRILRWEESRQRECGPEGSVTVKQGARLWALRRVGHEEHS